ncbi:MAG: leucine--tRNA ligase [Parachlamydiaceae bacterium]
MRYDHHAIETKWQSFWDKKKVFKTSDDLTLPKYYVLDMFPYPSGSGLHVGHPAGYLATDVIARYKRAKGFNVLHPMGWDSFGLPAEQYAVRTGTHPRDTTKKNIDTFRKQMKAIGFSYDWDREIATSDPSYYKWTQWIFAQLYKKGLAYEAVQSVNFCPALGTVLANEEVENGVAKEGGFPVEKRPLRQWILKITAYADRLIKDLDLVDWPESLKRLQINWIGRSEGAKVHFALDGHADQVTVYTTCPHTLFGATYMVLAPEHPLVAKITTADQKEAVDAYVKVASQESDLERTDLNHDKTGVFTGAYAINPVNGRKIPVWISDYVLMSYGTGAIMAVPAHDERDMAFAKKFHLPIDLVIDEEKGQMVDSANGEISLNGLTQEKAITAMIAWLEKKKLGEATVNYKLRDWLFSRQRYWGEPFPILHCEDGTKRVLELDELPLTPPELTDFKPSGDGQSPLAKVKEWIDIVDPKTGKVARRESNTMPQWAGSCWYYLRFIDPHNEKEAWNRELEKYWMPVDLYVGGVEHAVLHLLYARFWHKVLYDLGLVSTLEPFQTLRNQGLVVARSYQRENGLYVAPEDVVEENGEYFLKSNHEKLKSQIDKMSKSKLNGITPDEVIEEFGADSLRLYELFMGPMEKEKVWSTESVSGCKRFLNRFYDMATSEKVQDADSEEANKLTHRLIYGVAKDVEALQFNTAIAKMMEFMNDFTKLSVYPKQCVKMAVQALQPFAPHLAEEIWELLGEKTLLSTAAFPVADPRYLVDDTVTYVVQINGKLRGSFELPKDLGEEQILVEAKKHPQIQKYLDGQQIKKVVFVKNKLLNLVIG